MAENFGIKKRGANDTCPEDYLKIAGLDESLFPLGFPLDAEDGVGEVVLCGDLAVTQTYTSVAGEKVVVDFHADDEDTGFGFTVDVCVDA